MASPPCKVCGRARVHRSSAQNPAAWPAATESCRRSSGCWGPPACALSAKASRAGCKSKTTQCNCNQGLMEIFDGRVSQVSWVVLDM